MKHLATWIEKDKEKHFDELAAASDLRLWNARVEDVPWDDVTGLLLTGGSDVSADFLTQTISDPTQIQDPDLARDKWEFSAAHRALGIGLPVLAICRGHQVLNVALGGTLHLDIPGHNLPEQKYGDVQELRYESKAEIKIPHVNSSHHQAIDKLGEGLEIEAWHAVDHIIESVRLRDYPYCIGVQYHPERGTIYQPLFGAFLAHVK